MYAHNNILFKCVHSFNINIDTFLFVVRKGGKNGKVVPLRSIEAHLGDRRYSPSHS
jgi:hypothetical protein